MQTGASGRNRNEKKESFNCNCDEEKKTLATWIEFLETEYRKNIFRSDCNRSEKQAIHPLSSSSAVVWVEWNSLSNDHQTKKKDKSEDKICLVP